MVCTNDSCNMFTSGKGQGHVSLNVDENRNMTSNVYDHSITRESDKEVDDPHFVIPVMMGKVKRRWDSAS